MRLPMCGSESGWGVVVEINSVRVHWYKRNRRVPRCCYPPPRANPGTLGQADFWSRWKFWGMLVTWKATAETTHAAPQTSHGWGWCWGLCWGFRRRLYCVISG